MANEMVDKLVALLKEADKNCERKCITDYEDAILDNAEYLLSKGVIVPLCNIGDTVYVVCEDEEGNFISENKVTEVCSKGFLLVLLTLRRTIWAALNCMKKSEKQYSSQNKGPSIN